MKSLFCLTVQGHSLSQRKGPGCESVRHLKPLYLQIKITHLLNLGSSYVAYNLNPGNEVTHLGVDGSSYLNNKYNLSQAWLKAKLM